MIIRIEDLKNVSKAILSAVDGNEASTINETLELVVKNDIFSMNVTNREYYTRVTCNAPDEEDFHATVNANLFLKLVSQITTDTVEFFIKDNALTIKGNGVYKLPLIYDNDKLLELPEITIGTVTNEFDVDSEILVGILNYNSKQLNVGVPTRAVQRMYYIDDKGAITFTTGACVNSFELPSSIKLLLTNRIVKLFKLFKGKTVHVVMGHDSQNGMTITKVKFTCDNIMITAIVSNDDDLFNSVPVAAIRGRATASLPYSVNFSKESLLSAINRLMLFDSIGTSYSSIGIFDFGTEYVTLYDSKKENNEQIYYDNDNTGITDNQLISLDLSDLKAVLETCDEQYVNFDFGDGQAVRISRANVRNIIPEVHL